MLKFNDIKDNDILYAINLKTYQIEAYKAYIEQGNIYGFLFLNNNENDNISWSWILSLERYGEHDIAILENEYIISVSKEILYKHVQTTFDDTRRILCYFKDKVKEYEKEVKFAYTLYSSIQAFSLNERIQKMSTEEFIDFYNDVCMKHWDKKTYCFIVIPIISYDNGQIDWFHTYRNIKNVEFLTEKNITDINSLINTVESDTKYVSYELLKGYTSQFKKLDRNNMTNIIIKKEININNEEII